jgi:2'-5' RNA ligase
VALEPRAPAPLAAWRDALIADRTDLRPVPVEALHVTLVFLGWQYERDVERIAAACAAQVERRRAALLTPAGVLPLPPRGAPRLFALELDDEGERTRELQGALVEALRPFHRPERRPFWPHVTLARVKRDRRAAPLTEVSLPEPLDAYRVTLYRSTLRPQGAIYDALASSELTR